MSGKDLVPVPMSRRPVAQEREVFVEWYTGKNGITFDIFAGRPTRYSEVALKGIERIQGIGRVILNPEGPGGELIIVVQLAKSYQRRTPKIEEAISNIEKLLDIKLSCIAYTPGSGWQKLPLTRWAGMK